MLVFWRGWGALVPVLGIGILALGQLLIDSMMGKGTYTANAGSYAPIFGLLAAASIWLIGTKVNKSYPKSPTSGHSFMFIRMEYWAYVVAALSVVGLIWGVVS